MQEIIYFCLTKLFSSSFSGIIRTEMKNGQFHSFTIELINKLEGKKTPKNIWPFETKHAKNYWRSHWNLILNEIQVVLG